jgi:cysteine desulfurase/selenocysteine lyase
LGTHMNKFEEFRTHVPVLKDRAYLDSASTGLIPDFVYDGVLHYQKERYLVSGDSTWEIGDVRPHGTLDMMDWAKAALAEMLCCEKQNIIFGQNTSQLYALAVASFPFQAGDNVILPENGYTTSRFAWQILESKGLEIRYAKADNGVLHPEAYKALCDERTIALCANYVESASGFRMNLEALGEYCHQNDVYLIVDGTQGLGVMPLDVKKSKVDYIVGDDYKWMMGFCGAGYAYVSERMMNKMDQRMAGWMSDDDRFNTSKQILALRKDAGRYELGYPTAHGVYAFGLVAKKYIEMGREDIKNYLFGLCDALKDELADIPGVELRYDFDEMGRSQIVVVAVDDCICVSNKDFEEANVVAHFRTSDLPGKRHIRLGIHYYNNLEDIRKFCEVLRSAAKRSAKQ